MLYGKEEDICGDSQLLKRLKQYVCKVYKDEIEEYNKLIRIVFKKLKTDEKFIDMLNQLLKNDYNLLKVIQNQFYTIDTETSDIRYFININEEKTELKITNG